MDKKVLTAYFSYEGHTRKIAEKYAVLRGETFSRYVRHKLIAQITIRPNAKHGRR